MLRLRSNNNDTIIIKAHQNDGVIPGNSNRPNGVFISLGDFFLFFLSAMLLLLGEKKYIFDVSYIMGVDVCIYCA